MIYAMSDLHGCYDKYIRMLDAIQLKSDDTLIILGDVIDRGDGGIKILLDMMERVNIRPFLGNHEAMMYFVLKERRKCESERDAELLKAMETDWLIYNGGQVTDSAFGKLSEEEQRRIFQYLGNFDVYDELTVAGKDYFVSHAGLKYCDPDRKMEDYSLSDFVEGRMDYDRVYFKEKIILSGHTPTFLIGEEYSGKIFQKNNHIVLDCGAVFGRPLGCICLDTMEEFYVD